MHEKALFNFLRVSICVCHRLQCTMAITVGCRSSKSADCSRLQLFFSRAAVIVSVQLVSILFRYAVCLNIFQRINERP